MIVIENTRVFGFQPAIHDMRNPMESWDRSDSTFGRDSWCTPLKSDSEGNISDHVRNWFINYFIPERPCIGPKDMKLLKSLAWGGPEHRKALRCIEVWANIYPSRDVWQEIDTYKISTVRNSCSTMHKLGHRDLTEEDFALRGILLGKYPELQKLHDDAFVTVLNFINAAGKEYRNGKDYDIVRAMKKLLFEGFIQMAGYHLNYENLINMFLQRRNHRLPEWRWTGGFTSDENDRISICDWIYSLPYMPEILADHIGAVKFKTSEVDVLKEMLSDFNAVLDGKVNSSELVMKSARLKQVKRVFTKLGLQWVNTYQSGGVGVDK